MSDLLIRLKKELQISNMLLTKLAASPTKNEDGSRKPTTKKKRKKQKLSPEQKKKQKKDQRLINKVKDKLKDRKYKSKQTGDDLSFNTAYNRKHPKAVKDFNNAMEKARGSESSSSSSVKAKLSDEQYDLLQRVNNGRDMRDMSLVEERTMREIFSILMDTHEELLEEEPKEKKQRKTRSDKGVPRKKQRKTRSDKGVPRGEYKKRVEKKVSEKIDKDQLDDVNLEEAVEIPPEEVEEIKEVLDQRENEREDKKPKTEKKEPSSKDKDEVSEGEPLSNQSKSVQKKVLTNMLQGALVGALDPKVRIQQVKEMLKQKGLLSDFEKKSLERELETLEETKSDKGLPISQTQSRALLKEVSDSVSALKDLSEDQVESMMSSYSDFSSQVADTLKNQGMGGLIEFITDEVGSAKKPSEPDSNASEEEKKKYAEDMGKYLAVMNAQQGIVKNPLFGVNDVSKEDEQEHLKLVRRSQGDRFRVMDKSGRNEMAKEIAKRKVEIEKELKDDPKNKELISDLKNLNASEQALNTVRMLNKEGVIEGYNEVPDGMLEIARQTGENVWDEAITSLSSQEFSISDVKDQMSNVMSDLNDDDFSKAVGGSDGPYGGILSTIQEDFCPDSPANKAKGVGGQNLGAGESCPNPMPPHIKNMLRNYMSDSFVNNYTVIEKNENNTKKQKKQKSNEHKREMKDFWNNNQERFFMAFVDGVDKDGKPLTEEQREEIAEHFRLEWMRAELRDVELYDGVTTKRYKLHELQQKLKELKSLSADERREKSKEYREQLQELFESGLKKQSHIFNSSFIEPHYKVRRTNIMQKKSTQYVDYQRRSQAFELGMRVYPFLGGNPARSGLVVAIYPSIGMVDVQFPHGSMRYPVEDLVVDTSGDYLNIYSDDLDTVPGGVGSVPVSSPSFFTHEDKKQASRVASKYVKKAIYWYKIDRTYRQCRDEVDPCCPKCKTPLGKTVYKRRGGKSERLLACYTCLFIIKPEDIVRG